MLPGCPPISAMRATAEIQAKRRLGLTATLVREDGRETDVFSLIGPKKYDVPWRDLEQRGWIAEAACTEVRVSLPEDERMAYATAQPREMYRIAAENSRKLPLTRAIIAQINPATHRSLSTDSERYQQFKARIRSLPPSPTPRAAR